MKPKTAFQNGKPDEGNPCVRFDEGEAESAKPRRGSLLYFVLVCAIVSMISMSVFGVVAAEALVPASFLALDDKGIVHPWNGPHDRKLRDSWTCVDGSYCRKLRPIRSGRVDFCTSCVLTNVESVAVSFLDCDGKVVYSQKYMGVGMKDIRCVFDVITSVASVKITPEPRRWVGDFMPFPLQMAVDYPICETFDWTREGRLPNGWKGEGAFVTNMSYVGNWDIVSSDSLLLIVPGGKVTAGFQVEGPKFPVTTFQMLADPLARLSFRLPDGTSGCADGLGIRIGNLRYDAMSNVWYTIRVEQEDGGGILRVKLNGREIGRIPCGSEARQDVWFANSGKAPARIDNVRVLGRTACADGVPEPIVPSDSRNNIVGVNVCPLWHEGSHLGWDCIARCRDPRPVLGFYDEGEGESADWEIKYMVEHGIDFQAFCWFAESTRSAIKCPNLAWQLDDGFKNAQWSSKMKYCLIWEAANGCVPADAKSWREHYVPYFIEHHFKDPRYLRIANRPVLFVFGGKWKFPLCFGSVENARAELDYLEDRVRRLGCDGMIYVGSHENSSKEVAGIGFDATAAYNWGDEGYRYDVNTNCNCRNARDRSCYTIPTASVGFNNEPWGGKRKPMMTTSDFRKTLTWMRDVFEPMSADQGTWQRGLFMISTWNEYGEGTYIMPTRDARGFGYLDAVREVFTDEKADSTLNVIPTGRQLDRISRMFRQ